MGVGLGGARWTDVAEVHEVGKNEKGWGSVGRDRAKQDRVSRVANHVHLLQV